MNRPLTPSPVGYPCDSAVDPRLPLLGQPLVRLLCVGALLLLLLVALTGYFVSKRGWSSASADPEIIASYQRDYQVNEPSIGWRYMWNAGGPIGQAANYESLQWDGRRYAPMIAREYPRPAPVRFLRLTEAGGHPGQGMDQGHEAANDLDRFVIAAFTVTKAGQYRITNSSLRRHDGALKGGIHLQVFVNDREIGLPVDCDVREGVPFDRALGKLAKGDTIYVALGPDKSDTNDSFRWDFSIAR